MSLVNYRKYLEGRGDKLRGTFLRRAVTATTLGLLSITLLGVPAFAQTNFAAPPGAPPPAAPIPLLPLASAPPPNTSAPGPLSGLVIGPVIFPYFGPSGEVIELDPVVISVSTGVAVYSGPDATSTEASQAVSFGSKPAGSQFIAFFVRGDRIYVFDLSSGNYAWITATGINLRS